MAAAAVAGDSAAEGHGTAAAEGVGEGAAAKEAEKGEGEDTAAPARKKRKRVKRPREEPVEEVVLEDTVGKAKLQPHRAIEEQPFSVLISNAGSQELPTSCGRDGYLAPGQPGGQNRSPDRSRSPPKRHYDSPPPARYGSPGRGGGGGPAARQDSPGISPRAMSPPRRYERGDRRYDGPGRRHVGPVRGGGSPPPHRHRGGRALQPPPASALRSPSRSASPGEDLEEGEIEDGEIEMSPRARRAALERYALRMMHWLACL